MKENKPMTFDECKQLSSRIIAMNPNRRANMGQISSHLLDYYTELTKQPWLAQLVGQIRDLTAQQNQMMQQVADAVNAAQFENEDELAFAIIKKQEEMKTGETYQQLDRKISDLKKQYLQLFLLPYLFGICHPGGFFQRLRNPRTCHRL